CSGDFDVFKRRHLPSHRICIYTPFFHRKVQRSPQTPHDSVCSRSTLSEILFSLDVWFVFLLVFPIRSPRTVGNICAPLLELWACQLGNLQSAELGDRIGV